MDGPKTSTNFSTIAFARVIGYDSEHNAVYIQLASGQSPYLAARMLYPGNADQYRVEQNPLPLVGTWGVVAFPGEDDRFPIWLGSYYSTLIDALTSSSLLQDSQIKYFSHWSGYYDLLDGFGNHYIRYPDGTQIRINSNNTEPNTYRHVANLTETSQYGTPQIRVQLPDSERVPTPPPTPFYVVLDHPSGASATITPNGVVTITAGNPQLSTINMTPNGIITVTAGNPVSGSQATPEIILNAQTGEVSIYSQNQNGLITMDGSGNITIQSASGNIAIAAAKQISIEADSSGIAMSLYTPNGDIGITTKLYSTTMNTFIANYNEHYHGGVTTGTSNTEPTDPTDQIPLI